MSWLLYLIMFVAGGFTGYMLSKSRNPDTRVRELEEHLTSLQGKYDHYQDSVTQHFVSTAQLVNTLTSSYREVHDHLQRGAESLAADSRRQGSGNPGKAFTALTAAQNNISKMEDGHFLVEPPRDYAAKKPTEKGTLDEDYGFRD
jgi:uncharacterized membrane-anchored protein YhcB (DUF1043 family)